MPNVTIYVDDSLHRRLTAARVFKQRGHISLICQRALELHLDRLDRLGEDMLPRLEEAFADLDEDELRDLDRARAYEVGEAAYEMLVTMVRLWRDTYVRADT